MKILITGGNGFIGKHLVANLSQNRHEVYVIDKVANNLLVNHKTADLLDISENDSFFNQKFDLVIHLAAMVSVQRSIEDPVNSFANNTFLAIKMLKICKNFNIPKIIFSSSAAVYGNKEGSVSENDITEPSTPYGLDKLVSEKYIQMYCALWNIDYLILRFFNVFGQGQNPEYAGVITAFNLAAQKNQPLTIYGDGEQTRDFVNVNDICFGIGKLIDKNIKNEIFNMGTGQSISINNLAKQFGSNIIYKEARKEIRHSCANIQKLLTTLK